MYKGNPEEGRILEDAEFVYDYLVCKLKYNPKNLIIFGRSIGSGPATWLASRRIVGALVLMSPFTSIRAIINDMAGKWATYLIKERFNNLECMGRVVCPTFLCHGLKDRLISYKHSQELSSITF
jgi:abhydrolase domain-containing protein 17